MSGKEVQRFLLYYLVVGAVLTGLVFVDLFAWKSTADFYGLRGLAFLGLQAAAWAAFVSAFYVAVGRLAKLVLVPVSVLLAINDMGQIYARQTHDMLLDGDVVGIFLASSTDEMLAYVRIYAGTVEILLIVLCLMALVGLIVLAVRVPMPRAGMLTRIVAAVAFGLTIAGYGAVKGVGSLWPTWKPLLSLTSGNLVADCVDQSAGYRELAGLKDNPRLPAGLKPPETKEEGKPIGIFVLGESATRNRMGVYGYGRETTPYASSHRNELCVFEDVVGTATTTAEAMKYLLTQATLRSPRDMRCTLAQCLGAVGVRCELVTSAARWGEWDGCETFVFAGCTNMVFTGERKPGLLYDDEHHKYIEQALARAGDGAVVVFSHLKGSHFPVLNAIPRNFSPWGSEEDPEWKNASNPLANVNNYDNTITYTDVQLQRMIETLKATGRPAWLIYISDHGESVDSSVNRQSGDRNMWELPMIFWASPEYRKHFADVWERAKASERLPLQADALFDGFLKFALVRPLAPGEQTLFRPVVNRRICGGTVEYVKHSDAQTSNRKTEL